MSIAMRIFTDFINDRIEIRRLMTVEPEKVPQKLMTKMVFDAAYEKEFRNIMEESELPVLKTGENCFHMAELCKFGYTRYFSRTMIQPNFRKAAYWLLSSFIYDSKTAFIFLHKFVPECFIEGVLHK